VPGSPTYIGTGKLHDTHGPWNYAAGPYHYYNNCNRDDSLLHSEVGAPAASRMDILTACLGNAKLWPPTKENRYWLTRGAWWLHMDQMREWFGEFDGEVRDIVSYVRAFRFVQAEALRYVAGAVRYAADRKAGLIIWMGNEPFPNAANTSVLEYDGCPKPAYYELKRAFASTMLGLRHDSIVAKQGSVTVIPFLRSDATDVTVSDATLTAYDLQGNVVASHSLPTAIGNCDWDAIALPVDDVTLVRISASSAALCTEYVFVPEAQYPFSALLDRARTTVKACCKDGIVTLTNTGNTTALYCDVTAFDDAGNTLAASDGNLCLLPGERRTVTAPGVVSVQIEYL
jgi:beta-mannosidase